MPTPTDHTPDSTTSNPPLVWYQFGRGSLWVLLAIVGALFIGPHLTAFGVNEYTQRWLGACFKAASGAWGGYRISRGLLRIDPGSTSDPIGFALLHIARAIVVAAVIYAICSAT